METQAAEKCAHAPCLCVPPKGEKYCSQFCKEAGSKESKSLAIAAIPLVPHKTAGTGRLAWLD